jgi:hypothetical protein
MNSLKDKHTYASFIQELMDKQRKDIPNDKKLFLHDMKRICKNLNNSIFDKTECCIWKGYITNLNKTNKGTYVNFYFRNKKTALHRLLYINYVNDLSSDEYIKFNCENKGACCNITHLKKYVYNKIDSEEDNTKTQKNKEIEKTIKIMTTNNCTEDDLTVDFS